jgi:hypothetical protein
MKRKEIYMIRTTNTYCEKIIQEKLCTLEEYIKMNRLEAGQIILLGRIDKNDCSYNGQTLIVGNCTPSSQPSAKDYGSEWNFDAELVKLYVLEVHKFG